VPNQAPVAIPALALQDAVPGQTVLLDGQGSSDSDGDALIYLWAQVPGEGDPLSLEQADSAVASFVAPARAQLLVFRLIVSDGIDESAPAMAQVRVNGSPQADAGPALEIATGATTLLDGSGYDPDGDPIQSYRWQVSAAPAAGEACLAEPSPCLEGADGASAAFTPPAKGTYSLSLVVGDGHSLSLPETTRVRALNRPPEAVPGADALSVLNGGEVHLAAAGSRDADGDAILAYRWTLQSAPPGAGGTLIPAAGDVPDPVFVTAGKGSYHLQLEVADQEGAWSAPAALRVDAINNPPTAEAGEARAVENGSQVYLQGTGQDTDGDALGYSWQLLDSPPGGQVVLREPGSAVANFTPTRKTLQTNPALCQPGECYRFGLRVSDGVALSAEDSVTLTSLNRPPIAEAGPDQQAQGSRGTLLGSASLDPDGDPLVSYTWTQVAGPDVTGGVGALTGESATFSVNEAGAYGFDLVVSDGEYASAPDRTYISFQRVNHAPVLSLASLGAVAMEGEPFALDATASADPDGDPILVTWTRVSGHASFPDSVVGETPSLLAPPLLPLLAAPGSDNSAVYQVLATDGEASSAPLEMTLHVAPGPGFVLVSTAPEADDAADPPCGSLATPCQTLPRALQVIDPWPYDYMGDGRHILMTVGQWSQAYGSGSENVLGLKWRGGARLFAGRDPATFARTGHSQIRATGACSILFDGLVMEDTVGQDVVLEGLSLTIWSGCAGERQAAVRCTGCRARLRDCEFTVYPETQGCVYRVGARVEGNSAELSLEDVDFWVPEATQRVYGVHLLGGSQLVALDTRVHVAAEDGPGADTGGVWNAGVRLEDLSTLSLQRSLVLMSGAVTTGDERTAAIAGAGNALVENSVLYCPSGPDARGLDLQAGDATLINVSLVGASAADGLGAAVRVDVPVTLFNTLATGFARALRLDTATALGSQLHANAFSATGPALATCLGTEVSDLAQINGLGNTCNQGMLANEGNLTGPCPLVDPGTGDFHLVPSEASVCQDAGVAQSPVGQAPIEDLDGEPRPAPGGAVDIGADEVQP